MSKFTNWVGLQENSSGCSRAKTWFRGVMACLLLASAPAFTDQTGAKEKRFIDKSARMSSLWASIPFYAGADLAQYQLTMSQSRGQVRQQLLGELSDTLLKLAGSGAKAEAMLEPLADIMLVFDRLHDLHKARDVERINFSLENQFKAAFDQQFIKNDVRDPARKVQLSYGSNPAASKSFLNGVGELPSAQTMKDKSGERVLRLAADVNRVIDYMAHGTFSSLGSGSFQVTLQLRSLRDGATRSFVARGPLIEAVDEIAEEVFDFFQRNDYPEWESPFGQLEWLPRPPNPQRDTSRLVNQGYSSFQEANAYCAGRGYRLPYARELMGAAAGGQYKPGGVDHLLANVAYPVLDRRHVQENYYLKPGIEHLTGGSIQPVSGALDMRNYWCVRGLPSPSVMLLELLWKLHRKNQSGDAVNKAIFIAVETLRFELGDTDTEQTYFNNKVEQTMFEPVRRLHSVDSALKLLQAHGIFIEIPSSLKRHP